MKYYIKAFKKYADFEGRATRKEYWGFTVVSWLVLAALCLPIYLSEEMKNDSILLIFSILFFLYLLFSFIPSLALSVRRLHDVGYSGWLMLLAFIPGIGSIVLLVFKCMASEPVENKYGPCPKT